MSDNQNQTDAKSAKAQANPRVLEVTRKGNIETTRKPNGTVIRNAVAAEVEAQ